MTKSNYLKYRISPIFLVSIVLLATVFFPILQADRFISDDWNRVVLGKSDWDADGRPLTELIMRVVDLGLPMLDISPLPQLCALACYAGIAVVLARKFRIISPVAAALVFLPIAANPLTLRNIAHRFDSLPIALSILFAVLPITLNRPNDWLNRIGGCLLLVGSLCLYQASINFFLVFAVLELVSLQRDFARPQSVFRICSIRVIQLLAALIIYLAIAALAVRGEYAVHASQFALDLHDLPLAVDNELAVWSFVWHKFPLLFRIVFTIILGAGISLMIWTTARYVWCVRKNSSAFLLIFLSGLVLIIPIAWVLSAMGPLVFLRRFGPSLTRVDGGFGALLSSALILIIWSLVSAGARERWQILILSIPGLLLISFAAIYSNAQKEQKRYEEQIGTRLSSDLRRVQLNEPITSISVHGNVGLAPLVARAEHRFPIIKYLVEIDLGEAEFTSSVFRYYQIPSVDSSARLDVPNDATPPCDNPPSLVDPNYTITRCGDRLFVKLTSG
jgi:Glucosyl transferase GtrII